MSHLAITRYEQRLDTLFTKASALSGDPEFQAQWACYLCVLVSGFLEVSVSTIYGEYVSMRTDRNVANYVNGQLRRFQNPKMQNILELTGQFSSDWATSLKLATEGDLKDAVDSIVANRHLIAHGKSVDLSYHTVDDYYDRVRKVVRLLENQCV